MEVKLLTVRELASYLGVSIRQIYRLIDKGMPPLGSITTSIKMILTNGRKMELANDHDVTSL